MKERIHNKSLMMGVGLTLLVTLCIAASGLKQSRDAGRFQLEVIPTTGSAYIIDTYSGQVWQRGINPEVFGPDQKAFFDPKAEESRF